MCIEINVFFQVMMAGVAAVKAKILAGQVVGLQEDVKVSCCLSSVNISNLDTSPLSAGLKVLRQLVFLVSCLVEVEAKGCVKCL